MSRAKTQNPTRPARKRVATPPVLTPIEDGDVDAAFAGIRLESEPRASAYVPDVLIDVDADAAAASAAIADLSLMDDVPVEIDSGADFAPDLADLAEVRKADSPTRRAQTKPAELADEPAPLPTPPAKRGPPKPPPGKKTDAKVDAKVEAPKPEPAKIPSILSKVKAATASSSALAPAASPPAASPPAPAASGPVMKPLLAPSTGGASIGRIVAGTPAKDAPAKDAPAKDVPAKSGPPTPPPRASTAAPSATLRAPGPPTKPPPAKVAVPSTIPPKSTPSAPSVVANPTRMPSIADAPPTIVSPNPLDVLTRRESTEEPSTRVGTNTFESTRVGTNTLESTRLETSTRVGTNTLESPRLESPRLETSARVETSTRVETPPPVQTIDLEPDDLDEIGPSARQFPRGESAVANAQAYMPPRRAKRETSEGDFDVDEDAMTMNPGPKLNISPEGPPRPASEVELPRAASYLEYALRAGLPRTESPRAESALPLEPAPRISEMKIEPVPTQVLNKALRFDSEPKSDIGIQPVPTQVLDKALRFDSEPKPEVEPPPPPPPPVAPKLAVPKLALRDSITPSVPAIGKVDTRVLEHAIRPLSEPAMIIERPESEFDYSALALDADASGSMVVAPPPVPRADSALERALRDSSSSIDRPIDLLDALEDGGDESGDFGEAIAPLRRMQLAPEREPSVVDAEAYEEEIPETPRLQLAVYETAPNLQAAAMAIAAAGHAMAVGASGREGLEKIGIAIADGHIDAVLVGIPGGEVLIKAALSLAPWGPIVIASCGGKAGEAVRDANAAGADLVAIRPHDAERLGPVLLGAARILEQRRDAMAAQQGRGEDLLARLESVGDGDADVDVGGLQPFETFQRALELELKRVRRYQYALSVALFALEIPSTQTPPPGIKGILRARAGNALLHSIRDIDMATELDQDRFLVLLPYTDLTGATEVARRIIGSVGAIGPVVAGGVQFQPRLVGAIAGTKPGQQLSFNKLIRDAQRALEAARRDGAELAVQP